jgi:hypothetical protein
MSLCFSYMDMRRLSRFTKQCGNQPTNFFNWICLTWLHIGSKVKSLWVYGMIFGISLASNWCVLFQCTTVGANTLVDEFTAILSHSMYRDMIVTPLINSCCYYFYAFLLWYNCAAWLVLYFLNSIIIDSNAYIFSGF